MPVRERKEVQEMLWRVIPLLMAAAAQAAILPEQISDFVRGEETPVKLENRALWDEFGYDDSAQASYSGPGGKFRLTVWRLKDSTGAMAAFRWMRPAGAVDSKWEKLAVETPDLLFFAFGNYLFRYEGRHPKEGEFDQLIAKLPRLEKGALPSLPAALPVRNRVPASERYIVGPVSLAAFAPLIPPSTAAFSSGSEGIAARFRAPSGELLLAVFSYPTPHIARDRLPDFQKLQGAVVKRSGPWVAVVLPPADPDDAERLLAEVRYEATVTFSQPVPQDHNVGSMIIAILSLAGLLILFAAGAGFAFGWFRIFWRKVTGRDFDNQEMIVLHLEDK